MSVHTTRHALNELLTQIGYPGVERWNEKRVRSTIDKLPKTVDDDTDAGDHTDLLEELLMAVADNVEIVIEDSGEEETPKKKGAKKVAKKATKKSTKASEADGKATSKKSAKKKKFGPKKAKTGGKSNKQIVYGLFAKSPSKAGERVDQMLEACGHNVKEQTIRSWISQWRRGENFPSGVVAK